MASIIYQCAVFWLGRKGKLGNTSELCARGLEGGLAEKFEETEVLKEGGA